MLTNHPIVASGPQTVSGESLAFPAHTEFLTVGVDVTAFAGTTPTMDLAVEWSLDGTSFSAGESPLLFAQIDGLKTTHAQTRVMAPHFRLKWTLGGTTPSFTFSAHVVHI